jgi:hypothetical protein
MSFSFFTQSIYYCFQSSSRLYILIFLISRLLHLKKHALKLFPVVFPGEFVIYSNTCSGQRPVLKIIIFLNTLWCNFSQYFKKLNNFSTPVEKTVENLKNRTISYVRLFYLIGYSTQSSSFFLIKILLLIC